MHIGKEMTALLILSVHHLFYFISAQNITTDLKNLSESPVYAIHCLNDNLSENLSDISVNKFVLCIREVRPPVFLSLYCMAQYRTCYALQYINNTCMRHEKNMKLDEETREVLETTLIITHRCLFMEVRR